MLTLPGSNGGLVYFETSKRHFYYRNSRDERKIERCADSQFLFFVDSSKKKSPKIRKCPVRPGKVHHHEVLSQEMLELAVIRWECLLRIVSNRPQGTNFQLLQSVLSSWPHQLSIPLSVIESKISPSLSFYRRKTANNEFVQNFLSIHGEDKLARFRQVIVQFRSASAILGQF